MKREVFTIVYSEADYDFLSKWLDYNKNLDKTVVDVFGMSERFVQLISDKNSKLVSYGGSKNLPLNFYALEFFVSIKGHQDNCFCFCNLFDPLDIPDNLNCSFINFFVSKNNIDLDTLVKNSFFSIDHMVKYEREISGQNFVIDGNCVCGDYDSWKLFLGFYKSILDSEILQKQNDSLCIAANLYNLYFKDFVTLIK